MLLPLSRWGGGLDPDGRCSWRSSVRRSCRGSRGTYAITLRQRALRGQRRQRAARERYLVVRSLAYSLGSRQPAGPRLGLCTRGGCPIARGRGMLAKQHGVQRCACPPSHGAPLVACLSWAIRGRQDAAGPANQRPTGDACCLRMLWQGPRCSSDSLGTLWPPPRGSARSARRAQAHLRGQRAAAPDRPSWAATQRLASLPACSSFCFFVLCIHIGCICYALWVVVEDA